MISFLGPRDWREHQENCVCPFVATWEAHARNARIKFMIDPHSSSVGSSEDFIDYLPSGKLLRLISSSGLCPALDLELYTFFAEEFFDPATDVSPKSQTTSISFKLDHGGFAATLGATFLLSNKALSTERSIAERVFSSILKLPSTYPASTVLSAYFCAPVLAPQQIPQITALEIDCISPIASHLVIHVQATDKVFANIRDIYTLGGSLNSREIWTGLQKLEDLWSLLVCSELPTPPDEIESLGDPATREEEGATFAFELAPGSLVPKITVQIPISIIDVDVSIALETFCLNRQPRLDMLKEALWVSIWSYIQDAS